MRETDTARKSLIDRLLLMADANDLANLENDPEFMDAQEKLFYEMEAEEEYYRMVEDSIRADIEAEEAMISQFEAGLKDRKKKKRRCEEIEETAEDTHTTVITPEDFGFYSDSCDEDIDISGDLDDFEYQQCLYDRW